ncbi:MAG TPA: biosynthetic-type acetolactate synthase large subunit [Syntrophorhabdaceae bacterium]|nr:biosynthetic-type acetolactate synthase large subunit [Syntrophorhabdaceae bacterium]HPC67063.1 biosynthetic-type acetolactate synthase large subunit [Syntrophorhabdaceae bacterium]HQE80099.1 biosynthetic-type acetolactate synthase large subunit [Syntrophorhabdaceae bacterium]HQH43517.1 biosynthetic-type acetolactate synthase large subunit [Syntrophorhabdaceae bacterium]HQK46911.1 biosynthetic-type acetolactate synthase large subunit [Syntrophorhabdaceae bacterium]
MKKTGSQIFVESLKMEGVDTIFCYPGGATLNITDALSQSPEIRQIVVRHEQGAVHASDGYARATGKVGVCLVTSGPGATNTVTGIATAYMDSIPIVVFTCQVTTMLIGNDAFQEADIVGITRPCTKHNYLVKDVKDLARIIKEAFYIAKSGRPGPVLVDIPKDVSAQSCDFKYPEKVFIRSYQPTYIGHAGQIKRAVKLILSSKRPILFTGGGIISSGASQELIKLAEKLSLPVTNTLMGLGGFPGNHRQFLGMLGMHGTYAANMAITHSDAIIAIGARFDDRATGNTEEFAPHAQIIHVDIDPTSISKSIKVHIPIVGDSKNVIKKMLEFIDAEKDSLKDYKEGIKDWLDQIESWKKDYPLTYTKNGKLKPQYVIERIYALTKGDAIISTEVGQNQMWTAQFYKFHKPRTILTSGGLGTMGYGFPAAIGAQVAFPDRLVIDIAGDGSIQMNIQELATAVQFNLPVKVVILNNGFLGMVRQWQELFYGKRYTWTHMNYAPDFVKLAQAYNAVGYRIEKEEDVDRILKEAFANKRPTFIDVHVDPEEGVYPMVPAGAALRDMLLV